MHVTRKTKLTFVKKINFCATLTCFDAYNTNGDRAEENKVEDSRVELKTVPALLVFLTLVVPGVQPL